jgi:D-alanyl-D-alanine carboxypeptidase (penicillin-binding protein 5/6)
MPPSSGVSMSPLIDPGRDPRRRLRGRRVPARAALAVVLALAAAGAIVAVLLRSGGGHHAPVARRTGAPRAARARSASAGLAPAPAAPPRSAVGLPLGRPPLALRGIGAPRRDPLQIRFHAPPRAGLLFNLDSGLVLWQRNPLRRARVASLNKMMTALLTVRAEGADAHVLVTKEAVDTPGSKVGVLPRGRQVRVESMLYGLMLPSGNDAATALAERVAGGVGAFVARMNREAAHLGLLCTRFSSPSGYFDEGNFSCPADLAVLAHVDLAQPRLARITRTLTAVLPFPIKGGKLYLYNNNPLLIYHYPGLTGLKTGYTVAAGRCLVATAARHGVRLGVVLLDSPAPASQAGRLLDLGFERIYHQAPVPRPAIPPEA